jgi:hypothetical protein
MFKRIKRRQADGTFAIVEVPANYVLQDGEELHRDDQQPLPAATTVTPPQNGGDPLTAETVQRMIQEARAAERGQLTQQLETERQERAALQTRLNAIEQERVQAHVNGLTPDARRDHELQALREQVAQSAQSHAQQLQQMQQQLHQSDLAAYREHLLRMYGEAILPEMVLGNSRQELDAAASNSHNMYNQMRVRFEQETLRRFGVSPQTHTPAPQPVYPPQTPPVQQVAPVPTITVPQNPYFVPPQGYGNAGFPAPVSPGAVTNPAESGPNLSDVTTENAVRSGSYAANREAILRSIREGGAPQGQALGVTPRYMGSTVLPGGAIAPVASPMAPVPASAQVAAAYPQAAPQPPQYGAPPQYAQVQYAPPAPPPPAHVQYGPPAQYPAPAGDSQAQDHARAAAMDAIQRTRNGNNQAAPGFLTAREQADLRAAAATLHGNNQDSRAVYERTFQNTAPIAPN